MKNSLCLCLSIQGPHLNVRINRKKEQEEHGCHGEVSLGEDWVNLADGLGWKGEGSSAQLSFRDWITLDRMFIQNYRRLHSQGVKSELWSQRIAVIIGRKIMRSSKSLEWRYKWKNKEREFQWIMRHRKVRADNSYLEQEWWEGTQDLLLWIPALGQLVCPLMMRELRNPILELSGKNDTIPEKSLTPTTETQ